MNGNIHVQFLGEGVAATSPPYPTSGGAIPQGYPARKAPEETGKVPESLAHLADDYEEQVAIMVKNTGHLIQPLLVLIQGGIVLFIILAVFLPYIQVLTSLSGP